MAKHEPTKQAQQLQSGSATFAGAGGVRVETAVIRPARTRHGPRQSWCVEFVQLAIQTMQGANPPQRQNQSKLHRDVNDCY
jgi:hypothetical protein